MNIARPFTAPYPPRLGSGLALFDFSSLLTPRGGNVTVVPGTPVPVNVAVIGAIAAGVVVLAMLKKKKVI